MHIKRTLILGNGFLGKQFKKNGFTVWGRDKFNVDVDSVYTSVHSQLSEDKIKDFDVIVNCVGNADTRFCEDQKNWNAVYAINALLPKELSEWCKLHGKKFVQISSGCVYDDNSCPQREDSHLSSHCKYVVSKISGEYFCNEDDIIIRPRLFFGEEIDKNNLLCKIRTFDNFLVEINSFTSVQTIVESVHALVKNNCKGVFNVAQRGFVTVAQIAQMIGWVDKDGLTRFNTCDGYELRKSQGLYLVNNIMDTQKLEQYYKPRTIEKEIDICWYSLKNSLLNN